MFLKNNLLALLSMGTIVFSSMAFGNEKGFVFHGVNLEESKLTDVIRLFGKNSTMNSGETSNFQTSLCYNTGNGNIAKFVSTAIGGGEFVNKIIFIAKDLKSLNLQKEKCVDFKDKTLDLMFDNGIGIGTSKKSTENKLGKAKYYGDRSNYSFISKKKNDFSELLTIKIYYGASDKIRMIEVSKVTTR